MRLRVPTLFALVFLLVPVAYAQDLDVATGVGAAPAAGAAGTVDPAMPNFDLVRAPDRTPRAGTPLISNTLHPMQGKLELTGFFDFSYADKYVDHMGGHAAVAYHLADWFALEGFGGYLVGDETNIAKKVRQSGQSFTRGQGGQSCATPSCEPELPDLWQTTWFAGADVQWAPIYGKVSIVSEYDLNFQLYALLGGGIEGVRKRVNSNPDNDPAIQGFYLTNPSTRVHVNYGAGLRFLPFSWMALRLELRNYTGLNPDVPERGTQGSDPCTTGYTLDVGGTTKCNADITNNAMVQVGLSFLL